MQILKARYMGMCFGVRGAINQAVTAAARGPLTILGELVHNDTVLADLQERGIRTVADTEAVATQAVMITAHGASHLRIDQLRARELQVLNATCPLVHAAHRAIAALVADGCHPVIVGKAGHVEVRGMTEDLADFDIVLTDDDVDRLRERPRFGVAAQTTQPIERVTRVVDRMRQRFPRAHIDVMNTVCVPTRLRQQSAEELARQSDVVLVIGGARSNNTRELVDTCRRHCPDVFHIQTAADVRDEWVARATVVGITAGTSTPDDVIEAVEHRVRSLSRREEAA